MADSLFDPAEDALDTLVFLGLAGAFARLFQQRRQP